VQIKTAAVILGTTGRNAFEYLSKVDNLPNWASEFCRELRTVGREHKIITCDPEAPELYFSIRADRDSGVIDMLAGPATDQLWTFPTRVVDLPDGHCVYLFTMIQSPGLPDSKFEQQRQSLRRELENIQRHSVQHEAPSV
jgi:hypothetical protein